MKKSYHLLLFTVQLTNRNLNFNITVNIILLNWIKIKYIMLLLNLKFTLKINLY